MQISPLRHPLAVLRKTLLMGQKEFGRLIGRSARTVQSIELGAHPLSEKLALKISQETGVSFAWLMRGAPHAKPWVEGPVKVSYRRVHFEKTRFYREKKINPTFVEIVGEDAAREGREAAQWMPASERVTKRTQWSADIFRQIREIMAAIAAADAAGQSEVAEYRLAKFASSMNDSFGQRLDDDFLSQYSALLENCLASREFLKKLLTASGPVFWSGLVPKTEWLGPRSVTVDGSEGVPDVGFSEPEIEAFIAEAKNEHRSSTAEQRRKVAKRKKVR